MANTSIDARMISDELLRALNLSSMVLHSQYDVLRDRTMCRLDLPGAAHVTFKVNTEDHSWSLDRFYIVHIAPVVQEVFGCMLEKN